MTNASEGSVLTRPIGNDPAVLRTLNPGLDIWEAYETIHLLMPDGSMKLGGEAVAEVLRRLPSTRWFAWSFSVSIAGFKPIQLLLDWSYAILADLRPLLGCESCGTPSLWVKPIVGLVGWVKRVFGGAHDPAHGPHFTAGSRAAPGQMPASIGSPPPVARI